MRPRKALFACSGVFVPVFRLEAANALETCIIRELVRTYALPEFEVEFVSFWTAETHSGSLIPVMGVVTSNASPIELVRRIVRTNTFLQVSTVNVSVGTFGAGVRPEVPIIRVGAGNTLSALQKRVPDGADAGSFVRIVFESLRAHLAITSSLIPVVRLFTCYALIIDQMGSLGGTHTSASLSVVLERWRAR